MTMQNISNLNSKTSPHGKSVHSTIYYWKESNKQSTSRFDQGCSELPADRPKKLLSLSKPASRWTVSDTLAASPTDGRMIGQTPAWWHVLHDKKQTRILRTHTSSQMFKAAKDTKLQRWEVQVILTQPHLPSTSSFQILKVGNGMKNLQKLK